jgi:ATP-dependent DNA ligase
VPAKGLPTKLPGTDILLNEVPEEQPRFIRKMDCLAVDRIEQIPAGADWFREIKWDGYRVRVIHRGNARFTPDQEQS